MSLQLAEQFEANEQYEQAYEEYKKLYETTPDDIGLLERLGHISLILEKQDEAASYYYEILKRDVTNALAYDQLISIYEGKDKYKYYIYRGNKNSIEGKLEYAISDFKKALSFATENDAQVIMTRMTLANLYRQVGQDMKAIDEYNLILEYDNLHEEIFLQLADLYMKDEVYASAIDALQRAKSKGFDSDRINEALAAVYLKSGDAKSAVAYTKDELTKIQGMLELGEVEEAYAKLNALPSEYKSNPRYFTLQAQYCYSSKDFDKALEYIDEYNKLQPNSPLTFQMRALVFDENGDLKFESRVDFGATESNGNGVIKKAYEFVPLSWAITKERLRKGKFPFSLSIESYESNKLNRYLVAFRKRPIFPIYPWTRQPSEKYRIEIVPEGNHCGKYEFAYWYAHYFS